ncbi:MAG: hypothetical protein ACLR8Y_19750 [Alistipes indistinctus]
MPVKNGSPLLTRLVIVDDSKESRSSNTSLIFCFHNGIINTLNKVHTPKLGSPSNTQLNLRLILENVNPTYLKEFREKIEAQIGEYAAELETLLNEQTGDPNDIEKRITLFKLDSFSRQVVQDKYSLEKLRDFIFFLENCHKQETKKVQTQDAGIDESESRMKNYFYAGNKLIDVITISRRRWPSLKSRLLGTTRRSKTFNNLNSKIRYACQLILDIIPSCYERTLHNHFHKNFGINLFLEKYQEYLTKTGKDADNKGRFEKFLIDLGIRDKYFALKEEDKEIVKNFLAALGNLDQTSVSDAVQMIIRDSAVQPERPAEALYHLQCDPGLGVQRPAAGRLFRHQSVRHRNRERQRRQWLLLYDRLIDRLQRIKSTLALFDDSGSLWDLFCEKYDDHRQRPEQSHGLYRFQQRGGQQLSAFPKQLQNHAVPATKHTQRGVKIEDRELPKWRLRFLATSPDNINAQSRNQGHFVAFDHEEPRPPRANAFGAVATVTPQAADFAKYARACNSAEHGNNNSLLMLNNTLEIAQAAKRIKRPDRSRTAGKNASAFENQKAIVKFIVSQFEKTQQNNEISKTNRQLHINGRFRGVTGSTCSCSTNW